jgi:hypothetical protein
MSAPGSNDRFASLEVEPSRRNQERFHHEEHEEARRGLNFRNPVLRHLMPFHDIKLYLATNKAFLCR